MTDKELLELAAKAAGIPCHFGLNGATNNFWRDDGTGQWNPLFNDGDALRLAVQLEIDLRIPQSQNQVYVQVGECPDVILEPIAGDPYAATRRAIVRAAAEMGKDETK